MPEPIIEATALAKRFGRTEALSRVDVRLRRGHVLALFGENGAGKSTLVGLLSGRLTPDSGRIAVAGLPVHFRSPRDALKSGIALVSQELAGCVDLTVAENILVGHLPGAFGTTSRKTIMRAAHDLAASYGIELDLDGRLGDVSLADRQLVEILKALSRAPQVLLLDEPTASLSEADAQVLLGHVRRLARSGLAVVLITHRIRESLAVADEVLVLRNGRSVLATDSRSTTSADVVGAMLGTTGPSDSPGPVHPAGRPAGVAATAPAAIEIEDWRASGSSPLFGVDAAFAGGEVTCVYGLRGSGIESLAGGLAGSAPSLNGRMRLGTGPWRRPFRSPAERDRTGVSFVPSDRKGEGLALQMSIADNLLFPPRARVGSRLGVRHLGQEAGEAERLCAAYDVAAQGIHQPVSQLSGGNQQKVLIASRIALGSSAVILHEPTRGVDIGARQAIHQSLRDAADAGVAIVIVSSDIDEVALIADRVIVLDRGRIAAELTKPSITQDTILHAAAGAPRD